MAPSAPKYRYCQADFVAQLFQKNRFFGYRQMVPSMATLCYFRDPFCDPSNLDEPVRNEAGCHRLRVFGAFSVTHKQTDIPHTRTSYLGTGVAD